MADNVTQFQFDTILSYSTDTVHSESELCGLYMDGHSVTFSDTKL